jgi:two-component system chemotaxis response regulator CheY
VRRRTAPPNENQLTLTRVLSARAGAKSLNRLKKANSEPIHQEVLERLISSWGRAVQRILIVEDSATMRSLLAASLEYLGIPVKITEASSGFEAVRDLPREEYVRVVTDINMPDINGLELVSFVKNNEKYRGIPLVIVSTEGSDRDRDKGLGLGADAYLVKPFDPETLRQVARDLLSGSRTED